MPDRLIIGLMSGTSVDAIDAALVRIARQKSRYSATVLHHHEHPWSPALRKRLLAIMAPAATTTAEVCELNFLVAREFAQAVGGLLKRASLKPSRITAIGSHGQTVCHMPPNPKRPKNLIGSTLQLGDVSVIATLTGIPTVGNFRPADMALGGQGAPLVPWTDDALLAHDTQTRCIQNIGGIANVTYLPAKNGVTANQNVIAFDTGPGNMLMDAIVALATNGRQRFDRGGRLAARGMLDIPLFRELQAHPYFASRPPKSTGREQFGLAFAKHLFAGGNRPMPDVLHTLTRLTAWSIADAYLHFLPQLPDQVILCGGGADNPTLIRMLTEEFIGMRSEFMGQSPPTLHRIDAFGIPNKAKEAASFALLAAATLDGTCGNLPAVTGAARPARLGMVAQP